ncbi:MAG: M20/M25/M40 family metallo-hydrolase [Planctomycetota bacterium]|nr:MAG: M20/M25/M40 family metallo-hydrolase [Planctomycetota bacterium]REJ90474.1 MAG: M20/M25/M40 family metallo-hydrolase [Planctomycetota bacterium]
MTYLFVGLSVLVAIPALVAFAAWRLIVWSPGDRRRRPPAPLGEEALQVRAALQYELTELAEEIGIRDVATRYEQLVAAAELIERSLSAAGYEPRRLHLDDEAAAVEKPVWNLEVEVRGRDLADGIFVVGAHYDTIPESPGANDNGSAVVAALALARAFVDRQPRRTIRFVFFVNEESPYYMTDAMGSLRYAEDCRRRGEHVAGMICLETIGYQSTAPGSQRYPARWIEYLYPTTGDFITVVGNIASRRLVHDVVRGLRRASFPTEGIAAPRLLKDIFRSDHAGFWKCGYPALMITDTANFRYPHYHTPEDTVDKIDFDWLTRLVLALRDCLVTMTEA